MESIKELYRIGIGPSSSHTMGPQAAAIQYQERHPEAKAFDITLYGSLAATGKGHMTDVAILRVLEPQGDVTIHWEPATFLPFHPNGMKFAVRQPDGSLFDEWIVYSIGGGAITDSEIPEKDATDGTQLYPLNTMKEIMAWCQETGHAFWEYVEQCEGPEIWEYLREIWRVMQEAVVRGINHEGILPGPLGLQRKAPIYYTKAKGYKAHLQSSGLVYAYALAVSEENASGGLIVTAPTCGSCGVLPAVLYHLGSNHAFSEERILHALATAGLIGNLVKHNASISGANVGCQGEVGTACAMASAAACQLFGGSVSQIEYAAEMGLEHHLGMTCDPVCGLVQIPCIERNAFAAARALDANFYASLSDGQHRVSFDRIVRVMKQTGKDLPSLYKETAEGGLAKIGEE
ncbi:MAG: L-serine ammonia-lyase [Bacteroidaceae bacterium]|jgi:L-serine dehydratase|nr:L-serine ammonia-lyase [Bacteroidaceae bacterium]MBQ5680249.1 L-serine ammonia-lyase [Bacteroidaceae bacterium]MBQ5714545.1 L-serine ammonia-lyase [Bacteroidaceae bacterium]MBR0543138.1 L-serine ammonia-lyase [Bacteroidaceae bacterium]